MKKLNWGHGVTVFYSLFVVVWIVVIAKAVKKPVGLISKDYYEADLGFQKILESRAAGAEMTVKKSPDGQSVELVFPKNLAGKRLSGEAKFLRPSDARLDFSKKFESADGQNLILETPQIQSGLWRLTVEWASDGQAFLKETAVVF